MRKFRHSNVEDIKKLKCAWRIAEEHAPQQLTAYVGDEYTCCILRRIPALDPLLRNYATECLWQEAHTTAPLYLQKDKQRPTTFLKNSQRMRDRMKYLKANPVIYPEGPAIGSVPSVYDVHTAFFANHIKMFPRLKRELELHYYGNPHDALLHEIRLELYKEDDLYWENMRLERGMSEFQRQILEPQHDGYGDIDPWQLHEYFQLTRDGIEFRNDAGSIANDIAKRLRSERVASIHFVSSFDEVEKNIPASRCLIREFVDRESALAILRDAKFPQRERQVAEMFFLHDMTEKEISDCLNLSLGAVRSLRFRAKQRLIKSIALSGFQS